MSTKAEFMAQAALAYADEKGYKLPNKAKKDFELLAEVVEEAILENVKDIPYEDRFECEKCLKVVQEPDDYCWYCGNDVSDDGTGGFVPEKQGMDETEIEEEKPEEENEEVEKAEDDETEEMIKAEDDETEEMIKAEDDETEDDETEDDETEDDETEEMIKAEDEPEKKESKEMAILDLSPTTIAIPSVEENPLEHHSLLARIEVGKTGVSAWKIGFHLRNIEDKKLWKDSPKNFESVAEYFERELNMTFKQVSEFKKVNSYYSEQEVMEWELGVDKLIIGLAAPSDVRNRLLTSSTSKAKGGEGWTREKLREEVIRANKEAKENKPGPTKKVVSPLYRAIYKIGEVEFKRSDDIAYWEDPEGNRVEVQILKTKIKMRALSGV